MSHLSGLNSTGQPELKEREKEGDREEKIHPREAWRGEKQLKKGKNRSFDISDELFPSPASTFWS